jgi:hypothetical protein
MRILLSVLLLLTLLPDYAGDARLALLPPTITIRAQPVALDRRDPARRQLGGLTFLGGVRLNSPTREFGGFSAMLVDGERFTLISDGGNVVRFHMDARWRVRDVSVTALPGGPGSGWRKMDRDSESVTRDPATGQLWVGFERANQIWRYSDSFRRVEAHAAPPAMADWQQNDGAESMVRLRDGSFVVLAERGRTGPAGVAPGLWFAGDPVRQPRPAFRFGYRAPQGYRPTDIAELPDGRLVIVNRKASLDEAFTAAITVLDRSAIRPGWIARGREIARFVAPVVHDNFEAIAVTREGGRTILWIASDDNQAPTQASLLLKFRLDEAPTDPRP